MSEGNAGIVEPNLRGIINQASGVFLMLLMLTLNVYSCYIS